MASTETVNLDCPNCGETFVGVLSEDSGPVRVACPECSDEFAVVKAVSEDSEPEKSGGSDGLTATVDSWNWADERDPYTGSDSEIPVEQRIKADVRVDGSTYSFDLYYTPKFHYFDHVVRGQLDSGQKSKNAFEDESGQLYFKNRGVPSNEGKQWTYLDEDECQSRSKTAGLGRVEPDDESGKANRFRTYLGQRSRPLVDESGTLDEKLVKTLVKGLVVFQTRL